MLRTWVALLVAVGCGLVLAAASSAGTLPDGRSYEQVTPEEKLGSEAYIPKGVGGNGEYQFAHKNDTSDTETGYTFQAAAAGDAIAYVAGPMAHGTEDVGKFGGNEYLARRSASGAWDWRILSPDGAPSAVFQAFSPDLTTTFVNSKEPLSSLAPGFGEVEAGAYDVLYSASTAGGEYHPFFSTKPPFRSMESFGTAYGTSSQPLHNNNSKRGNGGFLSFEGASGDDTHLLFAANDALTEASEGRPAAEGGSAAEFEKENNLYESVDGALRLVNVLPDGTTRAGATFGGLEPVGGGGQLRPNFSHAISADGSRIFWTDLSTGHIYMRENGARTVEISPEGIYQTASSDGSTVLYTAGDLYAYDVQSGQARDLTPGVPVERVLGASENDEYVYYVTSTKELMLWHEGVSTPIATVVYSQEMRAEVTPNGRSVVFTVRGEETKFYEFQISVYVYSADTKTLYCASCASHETIPLGGFGSSLPMTNEENVYLPRWITTNGDRVFFMSTNGLVPQDTNEQEDVYEWVLPGADGCTESAGCINLLSGGTSTDNSFFLDSSENGEDVFIASRAKFVGGDEDGLYDVYDVRLNAPLPPAAPVCSGTGCQGVPNATPIFATPSSVTFEGVGNFGALAKQATVKPKPKPKKKKKTKHKKKHKGKSKSKKSARKAGGRRRSISKGGRS